MRAGASSQGDRLPLGETVESTDEVEHDLLGRTGVPVSRFQDRRRGGHSTITQTSGTATVTTATNHGYTTNDLVFIRGDAARLSWHRCR